MTTSDDAKLVTLEIHTSLGSVYTFPDFNIRSFKDGVLTLDFEVETRPTLTLVNVSGACLVLPTRIINKMFVDGGKTWERKKTESPA